MSIMPGCINISYPRARYIHLSQDDTKCYISRRKVLYPLREQKYFLSKRKIHIFICCHLAQNVTDLGGRYQIVPGHINISCP
jgi:hypothetical protein